MFHLRAVGVAGVLSFLVACGDSAEDPITSTSSSSSTSKSAGSGAGDQGGGGQSGFGVRGSVEQVHVWLAEPATTIEVRTPEGEIVASGTTDELGSLVLREVPPRADYEVVGTSVTPPEVHAPIRVMSVDSSLPEQSFYDQQQLSPGYNYITTRDGTKLSAYITLPGPIEMGPYPTVINYSGYNPSEPGEPLGDFGALCDTLPVLCDAPKDSSAMIAGLNGYATVGVNMRGTGCSGGAFDYFETLQLLDGYDVIETVAAQPWVKGNKVGMTGLSYPGNAQLFVARTRPPSLAAISPLSVIGGTYSTGRPGGIFNDGFALAWITGVLDKAAPYGQGWEQARVDEGDTTCEENQLLHSQRVDLIEKAQNNPYYDDELVLPLDPTAFADEISVPVFISCSEQDEQTGPFCFTLFDRFTSAPVKRFTMYNGVHPDGFAPQILVEWKAFLDIYVAEEVPVIDPLIRTLAPNLFAEFFDSEMQIPPDRFAGYATWEAAKAAYEAEQEVRVIFESGGGADPGAPEGTFERWFDAWPAPETVPTRFYFQPDGTMTAAAPVVADAASSFDLDPDAGQRGILAPGADVWDKIPEYDWRMPDAGMAAVFESAPLAADLVMVGSGSVDLWVRSPVDDADLEVNLTEVRPDGQEMFIQTGWLRASVRALAPNATALWPEHTYREEDVALLVPGEWTEARVGIPAFSHVFRAGSRIRIFVDTPGDSRASWRFALKTFSESVTYDVAHDAAHPSSVLLPVVSGVAAPPALPPCPSLRAQQCRAYTPFVNTPAAN